MEVDTYTLTAERIKPKFQPLTDPHPLHKSFDFSESVLSSDGDNIFIDHYF